MSDLDEFDSLDSSPAEVSAEVVPTPDAIPSAEPAPALAPEPVVVPTPQSSATPKAAAPAPKAAAPSTPTKSPSKPVSTPQKTPTKAATPVKKPSSATASPLKHLTADSILVTGREDKVRDAPPVSKYTKEQIEERVRARNRAKAHKDAATGLASGETVFDRISVKDSPVKVEKKPAASPQAKGDYNILVTGRDDKIKVTAKSPSKYTKEQIEEKVRARNRAKAHSDAARGLASGETVFDRIAVKDSPTKKPDVGTPTKKAPAHALTTERSDKIKSSPASHDPAALEAKAKARAKARTAASTKGGAQGGDILEHLFQDGIQAGPSSSN